MTQSRVRVLYLPKFRTIIVKQTGNFFRTSQDTLVIDIPGLAFLLKYLLMSGVLPVKVVEGILEEVKEV
jgi:hypothetical protein